MNTLDRGRLLAHLSGDDEREIGARALDLAEIALKEGEAKATNFLDPLEQRVCAGVLGSIAEISYRAFGGYAAAERRRLVIFPEHLFVESIQEPVRALELRAPGARGALSHRDFLGAILALGIRSDRIGDILLTDEGCHVVVAEEVVDPIVAGLSKVGRASVSVEEIDLERLAVQPQQVKEIKATVASLRLDAVASSGFGTSRTKIAKEIKAERVKINWKAVRDPAAPVEIGDVLSIRGRGRVVVESSTGATRKGRIGLVLKRYI